MHDVVHPLLEVGPVAGAAVVLRRWKRLEPCQQLDQLRLRGLAEYLWVRVGEMRPERQHPPRERHDHQRLRDRLAREPARGTLRACRNDADDGGGRTPKDRPQPCRRREQRLERAPSEILLRRVRGIERVPDLQLQARLLVQADLEVREERDLRARLRVRFEPPALVPRERLAEVALPVRRLARP